MSLLISFALNMRSGLELKAQQKQDAFNYRGVQHTSVRDDSSSFFKAFI